MTVTVASVRVSFKPLKCRIYLTKNPDVLRHVREFTVGLEHSRQTKDCGISSDNRSSRRVREKRFRGDGFYLSWGCVEPDYKSEVKQLVERRVEIRSFLQLKATCEAVVTSNDSYPCSHNQPTIRFNNRVKRHRKLFRLSANNTKPNRSRLIQDRLDNVEKSLK